MNASLRRILCLAFVCAATMGPTTAQQRLCAGLSLSNWAEPTISYPGHEGHRARSREALFDLSGVRYRIRYHVCADAAHGGQAAPLEGYIGMPEPSAENWYHGGFLFVRVNGQDIGTAPLSSMSVAENGTRAILDMVWHHPAASARARFVGLPGDNKLLVEVALEPKGDVQSVSVLARCYPSFFTAWYHRDGARRVKTPSTLVKEGDNATLPPADNWSLLYYDEVFDVARAEGAGPCAMALLPEEATLVQALPGGYSVDTLIEYRPTARRIRLAFWDLAGRTNADALAAFPAMAEAARQQMAEMDFTPEAVRSFDLAKRRADLQEALAVPGLPENLANAAREHLAVLERCAPALQAGQEPGIAAEGELLQSLTGFESMRWEIKLLELLDRL